MAFWCRDARLDGDSNVFLSTCQPIYAMFIVATYPVATHSVYVLAVSLDTSIEHDLPIQASLVPELFLQRRCLNGLSLGKGTKGQWESKD